ncbi:MAG: bile acid:sodium symporter family protein [Planctomycetota bacterium]|nr:bile acid:sodium symporter family protein [Planctomycetota bacterium]
MLRRQLLIGLCGSSLIAFCWPNWVPGLDPFKATLPVLSYLIALTMFAIGWMLPREEVNQLKAAWRLVLIGTAIQYITMPLLAFGLAHAFGLKGDYLIGVVMVGCVPGAMASNVLTLNARGNVSFSVSLTTMATLLSPIVVPWVMKLALNGAEVTIDAGKVSLQLLLTVVLPVLSGHLVNRWLKTSQRRSEAWGLLIANVSILWIIAVVVANNREPLSRFRVDLLGVLLVLNLLGYAVGYVSGWALRLAEPLKRALTLEIGMQNAGLGATLAAVLFVHRPEIAIAPAMYTFGCMLTGTALARSWGFWDSRKSSQPTE